MSIDLTQEMSSKQLCSIVRYFYKSKAKLDSCYRVQHFQIIKRSDNAGFSSQSLAMVDSWSLFQSSKSPALPVLHDIRSLKCLTTFSFFSQCIGSCKLVVTCSKNIFSKAYVRRWNKMHGVDGLFMIKAR